MILLGAAWACETPYTREQLIADLAQAQAATRALEEAAFADAGRRMQASIACLDARLPLAVYAATYRAIGAWHYLVEYDMGEASRWFRTAIEIEPTYGWDVDELPLQHPMRRAWETERGAADDEAVAIPGFGLKPGTWYLDGRRWTEGGATRDRPHLLQVVDESSTTRTWLVDGNRFPVEALQTTAVTASTTPDSGFSVVTGSRVRPREKTPLILAGVGGVLLAGGVYGAAYVSRQGFEAADTTDEVRAAALRTNTLVLASGGVFLIAAGVGWWGVVLEGGGGVGYQHTF